MNDLDSAIRLLSELAIEDPLMKSLHTAAMHIKVGKFDEAFTVESHSGGWNAAKSKEIARALKRKKSPAKDKILAGYASFSPPSAAAEKGGKESKTEQGPSLPRYIEDIGIIVGNTEHDKGPWRDYKAVQATIGNASTSSPLKAFVAATPNSGKKLSICVRTASMAPKGARRPPITGIALARAGEPPPPLLERVQFSLSRRYPAIFMQGNGGPDGKDSGRLSLHVARAGGGAPGLENLGLVIPTKELLPGFSGQLLRVVDGSLANIQPNSGGTPHVYPCYYRPIQPFLAALRASILNPEKAHGTSSVGADAGKVSEKDSKIGKQKQETSGEAAGDPKSFAAALAIMTGMMMTSYPHLVEHVMKEGASLALRAPPKARDCFASQVAAQAVHLVGVLGKEQRRSAEDLIATLAMAPDISLETRVKLAIASLLLLPGGEAGKDPHTWRVIKAVAKIYTDPSVHAPEIGELVQGEEVVAIEQRNGWVRHPRGWTQAYSPSSLLAPTLVLVAPYAQPPPGAPPHPFGPQAHKAGTLDPHISSIISKGKPPKIQLPIRGLDGVASVPLNKSPPRIKPEPQRPPGFFRILDWLEQDTAGAGAKTAAGTQNNPPEERFPDVKRLEVVTRDLVTDMARSAAAVAEAHRAAARLSAPPGLTYSYCDEASSACLSLLQPRRSPSPDLKTSTPREDCRKDCFLAALALCLAKHSARIAEYSAREAVVRQEGAPGGVPPAELGRREGGEWERGLRCIAALVRVLHLAVPVFTGSEGGRELFRRAVLPCLGPLFAAERLPGDLTTHAALLFRVVYTKYRNVAKGEMAVFLSEGIFPRICSRREPFSTRLTLVTMMLDLLRASDDEAVTLFFNFDADAASPGVSPDGAVMGGSSRLKGVLYKLIEVVLRTSLEGIDEKAAARWIGSAVHNSEYIRSQGKNRTVLQDSDTPSMQRTALECIREIARQTMICGGIQVVSADADSDKMSLPRQKEKIAESAGASQRRPTASMTSLSENEGFGSSRRRINSLNSSLSNTREGDITPKSPARVKGLPLGGVVTAGRSSQKGPKTIITIPRRRSISLEKNRKSSEKDMAIQMNTHMHGSSSLTATTNLRVSSSLNAATGGGLCVPCAPLRLVVAQNSYRKMDNSSGVSIVSNEMEQIKEIHASTDNALSRRGSTLEEGAAGAERGRQRRTEIEKHFDKALTMAKRTYALRFSKSEEEKDKSARAVKDSVKYLLKNGVTSTRAIADFLFDNAHRDEYFGKDQIAEYLATGDDAYHTNLRRCYADRIDLSHLDFVQALRLFLGDCGFLIINLEAAKVVRMMRLFAEVFIRDNPLSPVRSIDAAHTLASMTMAVHTGLWNLKARKQNPPPSAEDFASFLRGTNTAPKESEKRGFPLVVMTPVSGETPEDKKAGGPESEKARSKRKEEEEAAKGDFPFSYLMRQYADLASCEIKAIAKSGGAGKTSNKITKNDMMRRNAVIALRATRRLRARLRCLVSPLPKMWRVNEANKPVISKLLMEEINGSLWRVVNTIMHGSDRIDTTHTCLEVLAYGLLTSIQTDLKTEFQGLLEMLAEKTFVEDELEKKGHQEKQDKKRKRSKTKVRSLKDRLLRKEHLHRQTWFKHVKTYYREAKSMPAKKLRAFKQVLSEVSRCKAKVRQRKQMENLRILQDYFGHRIYLISNKRVFQKSAMLCKISDKGQRRQYTFFLFNDLVIYAAGQPPSYKVHQTLHLSLARLRDFPGTRHHLLLSPQKTFTIEYPSHQMKQAWVTQLIRNIEGQRQLHYKHAIGVQSIDRNKSPSSSKRNRLREIRELEKTRKIRDKPQTLAVSEAAAGTQTGAPTSSGEYETDPSLTSSFFNVEDTKKLEENQRAWVCKLCIRVHSTSRWGRPKPGQAPPGGVRCGVCKDVVCRRCATQTIAIKGDKTKVCDCCSGVLKGYLSNAAVMESSTNENGILSIRSDWSASAGSRRLQVPRTESDSKAATM